MRFLFFLLIMSLCSVSNAEQYLYVFSADWCGPCVTMRNEVWPNSQVKAQLGKFYGEQPWFFDSDDKSEEEQKYFRYYNIKSLPTIIIVDEKGSELKRVVGQMNVSQTVNFLGGNNDNNKGRPVY